MKFSLLDPGPCRGEDSQSEHNHKHEIAAEINKNNEPLILGHCNYSSAATDNFMVNGRKLQCDNVMRGELAICFYRKEI